MSTIGETKIYRLRRFFDLVTSCPSRKEEIPTFSPSTIVYLCAIVGALFGSHSATFGQSPSLPARELVWEKEISVALAHRDAFFDRIDFNNAARSRGEWEQLGARLLQTKEPSNPWYALLSGLVLMGTTSEGQSHRTDSRKYADTYFGRAIELARTSPGILWVLSMEFAQFDRHQWAFAALRELDRIFITEGGLSAQTVSQPLLAHGLAAADTKDYSTAKEYLEWAIAFDRHGSWPLIRKSFLRFPFDTEALAQGTSQFMANLRNFWPLQLAIFRSLHQWLTGFLWFFVFGVIAAFAVRYVPRAVHSVAHYYPDSVPLKLRTAYSILLLLSIGFLGVFPLLWATTLVVWRFLSLREKVLLGISAALLALAPFNTRLTDMLRQPILPGNSLAVFEESLESVYSPSLQNRVDTHLANNPDDYLSYVAASVVALKRGDESSATAFIRQAEGLRPNDPVVLLTAANVAHYANRFEAANQYYNKCIGMFPDLEASFFNPCLYYFGEMKFIEGITLIDSASRLNPYMVTSFIRKNDDYFSGDWPRLRYFLQPDYKSDFFFSSIFGEHNGSWKTADIIWGNRFLGIPLVPSAVIFGTLFVLLLGFGHKSKPSGAYSCKLCGVPTCRHCRKTDLCPECFERSNEFRDHPLGQKLRGKILGHRRKIAGIVNAALDMLFPGIGTLAGYRTTKKFSRGLVLVIVSAFVYGLYAFASTVRFKYPYWAAGDMIGRMLLVPIGYNLWFVATGGWRIFKLLVPENGHGSQRQPQRV